MQVRKKLCKKCNIEKLWIEFQKCAQNIDGLQKYCKECNKKDNKKLKQKSPWWGWTF